MTMPVDREANDEYVVVYKHWDRPLQSIYWTYSDNRERALRAAAATAAADGVTDLRVWKRPKIAPWEQVDWKAEVLGANSTVEPYEQCTGSSVDDA